MKRDNSYKKRQKNKKKEKKDNSNRKEKIASVNFSKAIALVSPQTGIHLCLHYLSLGTL